MKTKAYEVFSITKNAYGQ